MSLYLPLKKYGRQEDLVFLSLPTFKLTDLISVSFRFVMNRHYVKSVRIRNYSGPNAVKCGPE